MKYQFLLTTWEGGGNIPPAMAVVAKLVAAGHDVRVMSDACNRADAEAAGARFVPWTSAPSRPDKSRESDSVQDWGAPGPEGLQRMVKSIMAGPAAEYAADVLAEMRHARADLVITSEMLYGVIAACESVGQRVAVLTANVSIAPLPGIPPMGPGVGPARTDEERAMHTAMAAFNDQLLNGAGLSSLNAARAALGLQPLQSVYDQWAVADAILLGTSPAFDFSADALPANTRYVGPQLGAPVWAEPWQAPWPADDTRPLVLVSFSTTFQDHVALLQRVIDALGRFDVRVVATLGPALDLDAIVPAANTHVVRSAPHDQVMRRADLVVTHGGHGTVITVLAHGVPLLVLPLGRDQNDNAARVAVREAGLRLAPGASTDEIAAAADGLLNDARYRDNARRLGARVAEDARSSPIVAELEALAGMRLRAAC